MLNDNNMTITGDDLSGDSNSSAYDEICAKIKDDLGLHRKVTVKSLLDSFSKKPYGWRDLDILGMTGVLWKHHKIQVLIHDNEVDENNTSFKNDLVRKNNTDTMVIRIQEKIDEQVLYSVKRIMSDVYSENLSLEESKLKEGVVSFFNRKREFLGGLKTKYGSDYAGCSAAVEIYKDFDAILRASDTISIFQEIIDRKDSLEDNSELLEQLEAFYKEGSNQQKNYQEAKDICNWYSQNCSLQDLSMLETIVNQMNDIISMDMPFAKMNDLANLVFQANAAKEKILDEKLERTKRTIESDRDALSRELSDVMGSELTGEQKQRIQDKANEVLEQYEEWLTSLNNQTSNMDSYVTASANNLSGFRTYISSVITEGNKKTIKSKRVRIVDCIPTVDKKISSKEDIEKILGEIREKLLAELADNDELNLE